MAYPSMVMNQGGQMVPVHMNTQGLGSGREADPAATAFINANQGNIVQAFSALPPAQQQQLLMSGTNQISNALTQAGVPMNTMNQMINGSATQYGGTNQGGGNQGLSSYMGQANGSSSPYGNMVPGGANQGFGPPPQGGIGSAGTAVGQLNPAQGVWNANAPVPVQPGQTGDQVTARNGLWTGLANPGGPNYGTQGTGPNPNPQNINLGSTFGSGANMGFNNSISPNTSYQSNQTSSLPGQMFGGALNTNGNGFTGNNGTYGASVASPGMNYNSNTGNYPPPGAPSYNTPILGAQTVPNPVGGGGMGRTPVTGVYTNPNQFSMSNSANRYNTNTTAQPIRQQNLPNGGFPTAVGNLNIAGGGPGMRR